MSPSTEPSQADAFFLKNAIGSEQRDEASPRDNRCAPTTASRTHRDPEAKLVRNGDGREAKLAFTGHATMENRHGLRVLFQAHPAVGAPEADVAVKQIFISKYLRSHAA